MHFNITMISYNRLEMTRKSVESLLENTRGEYTFNLVDNGSTDGSREYLADLAARFPQVKFYQLHRNMGTAVAYNLGWASSPDADYYVKIDNDTLIHNPDWLINLAGLMERNPELGLAGYLLGDWPYRLDQVVLNSGDKFVESDICNGGCVMVPKNVHEKIGFWTEDYGLYGFCDQDIATRVKLAGFKLGYMSEDRLSMENIVPDASPASLQYENNKNKFISSRGEYEKRFVLNQFLFTKGLRPLYVQRRLLPLVKDGKTTFSTNKDYLPIFALQNAFKDKISYESQGTDNIAIHFNNEDNS